MHNTEVRSYLRMLMLVALIATGPLAGAQTSATPEAKPEATPATPAAPAVDEAASYSVGLTFGSQMHGSGIGEMVSLDAVMQGVKDGLAGKTLSTEDRDRAMQLVRAGREAATTRNRAAASDFLAQNGTAKGVVTTPSGLQYTIIEPGEAKAPSPTLNDRVTVHYRGRLLDGTEFDSSDKHTQAATFGMNGVIKGWREALLLMKPGAQWRLFIPPAMAYDANSPPAIPPGSLLIFDVELVQIEPPAVLSEKDLKGKSIKVPAAPAPTP